MPRNEAGWLLGADGSWYSPYVDIDGQWVLRDDIEWAPEPEPEPRLAMAEEHLPWATEYTDGDLRLTIVEPWSIDADGRVSVRVLATRVSDGALLDVHDGIFEFINAGPNTPVEAHLMQIAHQMTGV